MTQHAEKQKRSVRLSMLIERLRTIRSTT
jgi:hypothetical protein